MAKQLQIRGGTTAQHSTFTGAPREITVDTDKHTLVVHDEATAGGFPMARESVVNTALGTKVDKNTNITAGTATKVTYDAKGLVTSGTNPTTISGYGITDAYTKTEEDTKLSAMTKAQFNALAEERKANRAGSGFDEWGKHYSDTVGKPNVNYGIWTGSTYVNSFLLGAGTLSTGVSKTKEPIVTVNGYKINFFGVNYSTTDRINEILLPTAPTIYPSTTVLTAEQIASGVIKHADASNSGLIVNGKFDTDTSGWTAGVSTVSLVDNAIQVTNTAGYGYATQAIPTVIGKKYVAECNVISGTAVTGILFVGTTAGTNNVISKSRPSGYVSVEFVATTTTTYISVLNGEQTVGKTKLYDNIAVYPADAISRSDLVFLESWHEDISEKNFVYPLGNVQYLGGNSDGLTGIANGSFTGFETYSLFGNWQTSSALIGKGYVWSTLSESNKKAFISNPENNCYLDGDKVIQVRYRVRVQLGEDSNSMAKATVQGKSVTQSTVLFRAPVTTVDAGLYFNTSTTYTYTGTNTSAISIANVHRKNQGMYHNVYNPNGTKKSSDNNLWYNTSVGFTSISDCFDSAKLLTASGYIGTVSGRPDVLFYDQIHEGDILDLRNSSKKVEDYNMLISREFNKLVAGTNRGIEGEYYTISPSLQITSTMNNWLIYGSLISGVSLGASCRVVNGPAVVSLNSFQRTKQLGGSIDTILARNIQSGKVYKILAIDYYTNATYLYFDHAYETTFTDTSSAYEIIYCYQTTRTKSNTLLHCDIIGNPTNYPASWKQSGVFGTPLVVAEDGTSLLPNGTLDTFKLSRKANATPLLCLRSTNNGTSWSSFTPTFSTTTNAITLTDEPAANLVMVYYQTHTSMAVPVANSEVLEIGDVESNNSEYRAAFASTLIGKIPTYGAGSGLRLGTKVGFIEKPQVSPTTGLLLTLASAAYSPSHEAIPFDNPITPACKVFPYLTRLNGKAYLNLVFKEMKHNGTSWGDDTKFNIVDNVSTTTDFYGQTVLIGQKTVELPYFIEKGE